MEMESRHLVVMFIDLDAGLTFIGCSHSTSPPLVSTLAAWRSIAVAVGQLHRDIFEKGENVKKAAKHLRACLSWRESIGIGTTSFFLFI